MTEKMSKFLEAAAKDAALTGKLQAAETMEAVAAIARENGFDLTDEDLKVELPTGALDDDALDDVAGGAAVAGSIAAGSAARGSIALGSAALGSAARGSIALGSAGLASITNASNTDASNTDASGALHAFHSSSNTLGSNLLGLAKTEKKFF